MLGRVADGYHNLYHYANSPTGYLYSLLSILDTPCLEFIPAIDISKVITFTIFDVFRDIFFILDNYNSYPSIITILQLIEFSTFFSTRT